MGAPSLRTLCGLLGRNGFPRRDNKKKIDYSTRDIKHRETSHGARFMTFARNSAQARSALTCSIGCPACANLCGLPEAPIDLVWNECEVAARCSWPVASVIDGIGCAGVGRIRVF